MFEPTAAEIANEIQMTRSQFAGVFLVVEGPTDRMFMDAFICRASCRIVVANGKKTVPSVIDTLDRYDFRGVLGLVDADFDRLLGVTNGRENVVMYQHHDLETMLLNSDSLRRVLVEFGSAKKITSFSGDILSELTTRALALGFVRLYSCRSRLNLRFTRLDFNAWIDRQSFSWCQDEMIRAVKNCSQRHDIDSRVVHSEIARMAGYGYDVLELCNGGDLVEILAIALRGIFRSSRASEVRVPALLRALRLGYSRAELMASSLGIGIRKWEICQSSLRVLA